MNYQQTIQNIPDVIVKYYSSFMNVVELKINQYGINNMAQEEVMVHMEQITQSKKCKTKLLLMNIKLMHLKI